MSSIRTSFKTQTRLHACAGARALATTGGYRASMMRTVVAPPRSPGPGRS